MTLNFSNEVNEFKKFCKNKKRKISIIEIVVKIKYNFKWNGYIDYKKKKI